MKLNSANKRVIYSYIFTKIGTVSLAILWVLGTLKFNTHKGFLNKLPHVAPVIALAAV